MFVHTKKTDKDTRKQNEALQFIADSFKSTSLTNFPLKPGVAAHHRPTQSNATPAFYRQRTMPHLNHSKNFFNSPSEILNESSIIFEAKGTMTNERLSMMCPVSLHYRLAFDKTDMDCKCRRQTVPFINDVEYDVLLKRLPGDQLAVIAVTDSGYASFFMIYSNFHRNYIYL